MLNKKDLINSFINGATIGKGSNLFIQGNKLINYRTVIAIREKEYIYLNSDKYSQTTTRNQNIIRQYANHLIELSENEIYELI